MNRRLFLFLLFLSFFATHLEATQIFKPTDAWINTYGMAIMDGKVFTLVPGERLVNQTDSNQNDISSLHCWSSQDGVNWEILTEDCPIGRREYSCFVSFKGRLYVIGGHISSESCRNDVWSSSDGAHWELMGNAPFCPRSIFNFVVFKNAIWVFGGRNSDNETLRDAWMTTDGKSWTKVADNANLPKQRDINIVAMGRHIYVLSTAESKEAGVIWQSEDGIHWSRINSDLSFRSSLQGCAEFNGKIYIAGYPPIPGVSGQMQASPFGNWVFSSTDAIHWVPEAQGPSALNGSTQTYLLSANDRLFLFNEKAAWIKDLKSTWTRIDDLPLQIYGWSSKLKNAVSRTLVKLNIINKQNLAWSVTPNSFTVAKAFPRSMSTAYFKNKFWIIGGQFGDLGITNAVWCSTNGSDWSEILHAPPFLARTGSCLSEWKGSLWLWGGTEQEPLSDVWKSDDGLNWINVTTDGGFMSGKAFEYASGLACDKNIGILSNNSAWFSTDGVHWNTPVPPWTYDGNNHYSAAFFKDKYWVATSDKRFSSKAHTTILSAEPGGTLQIVVEAAPFTLQGYDQLGVFKDQMIFLHREENESPAAIWTSGDGTNWNKLETQIPWRDEQFLIPFFVKDRLYIITQGRTWVSSPFPKPH